MAKFSVHQIRTRAREIVASNPGGIRYKQLVRQILAEAPDTPLNTVMGSVYNLQDLFPKEIAKPSRGLYQPLGTLSVTAPTPSAQAIHEREIYAPFAAFLKEDLDEVTVSSHVGGNGFKHKWGTPDVVGVYRPTASNLIKFTPEIVAAEIKVDPAQPVVAFGQAIAYRLFATKSYIVFPETIGEVDLGRLEALCMSYGVGLVLFRLEPKSPEFAIRVRAQRFVPDAFYVNEFADRLKEMDRELFEKLFG